jgi:hypothetical protein
MTIEGVGWVELPMLTGHGEAHHDPEEADEAPSRILQDREDE